MQKEKSWKEWLWDAWCVISVVGIWPRFIEPNLLLTSRISVPIERLPPPFQGFKILQLSDLHWDSHFPKLLLWQLNRKIRALKPDLIVFTGDLISRSTLENKTSLKQFLTSLKAPYGCFAVLGNHDYARYVCLNSEGDYDVDKSSAEPDIAKGFRRLFRSTTPTKKVTPEARAVEMHAELVSLFNETGFRLLNNETVQISLRKCQLNLSGLEEYVTGRFDPDETFKNYKKDAPGIVLAHNPDGAPALQNYPGDLILSGHTHGGEINLPYMWKKFCIMENPSFKRGLKQLKNKQLYINRGVTSIMKFRWFAPPELALITLRDKT